MKRWKLRVAEEEDMRKSHLQLLSIATNIEEMLITKVMSVILPFNRHQWWVSYPYIS
jgi:hypothetical protein